MHTPLDLAIAGAGPAGAAAALRALAVRPDARVLLIDSAAFPRDKACGDGISPVAVANLEALGVADVLKGATAVQRMRIVAPSGRAVAGAVGQVGYVLPRQTFDARLVEAATARGAALIRGRVTRLEQHDGYVVVNDDVTARVVVGADGANSVVRRAVGGGGQALCHSGIAVRGYLPVDDPGAELLFRYPRRPYPGYAWSFPVGDSTANVGFALFGPRRRVTRQELLDGMSALLGVEARNVRNVRGHLLPLSTARPPPAHGHVLLAGDAASLVNPLTGEGIATALLSGALAGECAVGQPDAAGQRYTAALSQRLGRYLRDVRLAARAYRWPAGTDAAVAAASRSRRVFDDLVELSLGTGSLTGPLALGVGLGWLPRLRRSPSER